MSTLKRKTITKVDLFSFIIDVYKITINDHKLRNTMTVIQIHNKRKWKYFTYHMNDMKTNSSLCFSLVFLTTWSIH